MDRNTVDLGILVIAALFAFLGLRRGFVDGMADLVVIAIAFVVAVKAYPFLAGWMAPLFTLPYLLVSFGAALVLFVLGDWLLGMLVEPLLKFMRNLLLGPTRVLDAIGGVLPGLIKGLLVGAFLSSFFVLFPVSPTLREGVQSSALGSRLAGAVGGLWPRVESGVGGVMGETALFLTPPADDKARLEIKFPAGLSLKPDPLAEQRMLELANEERKKAGLKPLVLDERLKATARARGEEMFRNGYLGHTSPYGDGPADRLRQAQVSFQLMGENLAYAPSSEVAHSGLMNSASYRGNILSPNFGRVGIGVVDAGLYGKMFAQEFTN